MELTLSGQYYITTENFTFIDFVSIFIPLQIEMFGGVCVCVFRLTRMRFCRICKKLLNEIYSFASIKKC